MANSYYEEIIPKNQQLPFIFHTDTPGKHIIASNWHESMEILYCIDGCGKVRCDDEEYDFKKGEIFIIESNMIHTTYKVSGEFTYRCLIIDQRFPVENGLMTENIHFPRVIEDFDIAEVFERVVNAFYSKSSYKGALIRCAVLDFLINIYEKYSVFYAEDTGNKKRENIERIKKVIIYIRQNYTEKITLDDIAESAKMSKYYLSREFKQVTGQTLFEFLNVIRCKEAKRLIKSGRSVSDSALSCGFENMSYFTRTYKKIIGDLPSKVKV